MVCQKKTKANINTNWENNTGIIAIASLSYKEGGSVCLMNNTKYLGIVRFGEGSTRAGIEKITQDQWERTDNIVHV